MDFLKVRRILQYHVSHHNAVIATATVLATVLVVVSVRLWELEREQQWERLSTFRKIEDTRFEWIAHHTPQAEEQKLHNPRDPDL